MKSVLIYFGFYYFMSMSRLVECKVSDFGGWTNSLDSQYHIQTDEGEERYFKYQTKSGQYRKEKRLQDGTVVGTYGWVDPSGYLRLRDYIADNQGFRVVKTKLIYVGGKSLENESTPTKSSFAENKLRASYKIGPTYGNLLQSPSPEISPPRNPAPPFTLVSLPSPSPHPPTVTNSIPFSDFIYSQGISDFVPETRVFYVENRGSRENSAKPFDDDHREYDGISTVQNGFRYFLPRQYHEETSSPDGRNRAGSFGYVDPFGIRRVIYYNASPGRGFLHKKNNRYVGFSGSPYDPRPYY